MRGGVVAWAGWVLHGAARSHGVATRCVGFFVGENGGRREVKIVGRVDRTGSSSIGHWKALL